jgi:SAM-dependent methyltransferase
MAENNILEKKKQMMKEAYNKIAPQRDYWINKNRYYYNFLKKVFQFFVEPDSRVLLMRSDTGMMLDALKPRYGVGVDYSEELVKLAREKYPHLNFLYQDLENLTINEKFDYIVLFNLVDDVPDLGKVLKELHKVSTPKTRIVISNINPLWHPIWELGKRLSLKMPQKTLNWLSISDIKNILYLAGFEVVKKNYAILFPKYIPIFSALLNKVIAKIPGINRLCVLQILVAKQIAHRNNYGDYSCSIVIPCKNEEGNIEGAVKRIPQMGKETEIIFVDDKSTDGTRDEILKWKEKFPNKNIKLVDGPGKCKALAVWEGFKNATGDILMILDGDLTVMPEELPQFFNAIVEGKGEFINGCRLIYPMEGEAMRTLNVIGNKFFSLLFSYLLGQRIKDTLCGTKVFWRDDFLRMKKYIGTWGTQDRWGDYDLLFSASKLSLKIIDLPVHYVERTFGETKMNKRIKNALIMLKMCWAAFRKLKHII